MKSVISLYKPAGMTPLQAVERFKINNPKYAGKKISYPGRLDPMAQGILLLLVGDENKKMIEYMGMDKDYQAQILIGFSTDSYDVLGLPEFHERDIGEGELKKEIKSFPTNYTQTFPPYSSYKIKGKPLFHYARNKTLPEQLPQKKVQIKNIKINSIHTITANRLLKQIQSKISKLRGNFRQEEILKQWNKLLIDDKRDKFQVADITFQVSSGTYIRAIAHDLGQKLNTGAILLNLIRTRVGKYDVRDSVRLRN